MLTYWPDVFPSVSIQFSFEGTAVYVYFILANQVPGDNIITQTLANFTLDGQLDDTFSHLPSNSTEYQYNSLVFSKDGLFNTNHTLVTSMSDSDNSYINFDYANYTFDSDTATTVSSKFVPVAVIAGGHSGRLHWRCRTGRKSVNALSDSELAPLSIDDRSLLAAPTQPPTLLPQSFAALISSKRLVAHNHSVQTTRAEEISGLAPEMRQTETDEQIQRLAREIQALAHEQGMSRRLPLEDQLNFLRGEIERLRAHIHSVQDQGLSGGAPPKY
ncbi:hypothetical protein H0H92_013859 [Tricholoma furcatifolium]|nr:hypothetical protein H0H92_013859 [Tricholoma furcatifolium]